MNGMRKSLTLFPYRNILFFSLLAKTRIPSIEFVASKENGVLQIL